MTLPGMQAGVSDVQGLVGPQLTAGDSDSVRADHVCKGGWCWEPSWDKG